MSASMVSRVISPPALTLLKRRRLHDTTATAHGVHIVTYNRPVAAYARCHYCGARATTRDHIVARAVGGRDAWWNLVPSCASCNEAKAATPTRCSCGYCVRAGWLWVFGYRRGQVTEYLREEAEGVTA